MLISAHFPLADLRHFLDGNAGRLSLPHWANPDTDSEFVRCFGPIRLRHGGGSGLFAGEDRLCRATRALRFPRWPYDAHTKRPVLRCAFRGFYADGEALAKFDVGVADPRRIAGREAAPVIRDVLALPVLVPSVSNAAMHLADAGSRLAVAYLAASTKKSVSWRDDRWWVRSGSLLLMVHLGAQDELALPDDAAKIEAPEGTSGIELTRWQMPFAGTHRPVWFIRYDEPNYQLARQLRIDLVRLHCERVCLGLVLKHIATGKLTPDRRSPASDTLQRYLHESMKRIAKLVAHRRDALAADSALRVRLADEQDASATQALQRDLEAQLRAIDVRGNIARNALAWASSEPGLDREDIDVTALRDAIVRSFDLDGLRLLCADLQENLRAAGFDLPLSVDIVGGTGTPAIAANLIERVRQTGTLRYLLELVRTLRPNVF